MSDINHTPERRTVSIMCSSIRGYTVLCEPLEPEVVAALLDMYYAEAAEAVRSTHGHLLECVGDRVVAVWTLDEDRSHHAALAIRAGLRMISRGTSLNESLRAADLPAIRFGVGVDSGDAMVGEMGSGQALHVAAVGDTVNRAELLSEVAGGGEMLIGDTAHAVVAGEIEVVEAGEVRLGARKSRVRVFVVSARA